MKNASLPFPSSNPLGSMWQLAVFTMEDPVALRHHIAMALPFSRFHFIYNKREVKKKRFRPYRKRADLDVVPMIEFYESIRNRGYQNRQKSVEYHCYFVNLFFKVCCRLHPMKNAMKNRFKRSQHLFAYFGEFALCLF